jgi:pectinesterase
VYVTPNDNLQNVLDHVPEKAVVHLAPGLYRQKVVVRTPGITLVGAGTQHTTLIYGDYALKLDDLGREYNTFRTYTLAICADGVTMRALSVVNDALQPETKGQEVALSVCADDFLMEDCILRSTQDTLFAGPLPPDLIVRYNGFLSDELRRGGAMVQRFMRCKIEGTVDFIFGCGHALFEDCEIRSLTDARDIGYVAAPAHELCQTEGFVFRQCRFTCEDTVTPGSIFLARPWRDYGLACFENCTYDRHIAACGFDKWDDTNRDQTARFFEMPPVNGRVSWVNRR